MILGGMPEGRGKFGRWGPSVWFGHGALSIRDLLPPAWHCLGISSNEWEEAGERMTGRSPTTSCSWITLLMLALVLFMCVGSVTGTSVSSSRAATAANAGGAGTRAVTGVQKAKRPKGRVKRFRADATPSAMPASVSSRGPHKSLSLRVDDSQGTTGYPLEFGCSVCLDLAWKPVVLPCGHVFCFWCCHRLSPHPRSCCCC